MTYTSFNTPGKLLLLIGNFQMVFLIACLYEFSYRFYVGFILFLILVGLSIFANILWIKFVGSATNYNPMNKSNNQVFKKINNGNILFSAYALILWAIIPFLLLKGYLGLVIFGIILFFLSVAYQNTNIILFNPLLSLLGYKFYIIEYDDEEVYAISKNSLTANDLRSPNELLFYVVVEDFYLIKKGGNTSLDDGE